MVGIVSDPELTQAVRKVISDAYYDVRNAGQTMEHAADRVAAGVVSIIEESEQALALRFNALAVKWKATQAALEAAERFVAHLQASLAEALRVRKAVLALCEGPLSEGHQPYVADLLGDGNVEFVLRLDDVREAAGWQEEVNPDG